MVPSGTPWISGPMQRRSAGGLEAVRGVGEGGKVVDQMRCKKARGSQLAFADVPVTIGEAYPAANDRSGNRERDDFWNAAPLDAV